MLELNQLYLMDCMEGMAHFPDKYFDLAVIDPPYGSGNNPEWDKKRGGQLGGEFDKYKVERTGGAWAAKYGKNIKHWDIAPDEVFFAELFRVSKNQIIWGGNYFNLPPTRCFLIWQKLTISESFSMAMCEYAWTSFNDNAKIFACAPQGTKKNPRFHPTQKPVKLYHWLLSKYAQPGDRILDTHVGSASSLVACHQLGFDFCGFEIDPDYHIKASQRLVAEKTQKLLAYQI